VKGASATLNSLGLNARAGDVGEYDDVEQVSKQLEQPLAQRLRSTSDRLFRAAGIYYDKNEDIGRSGEVDDQALEKNKTPHFMNYKKAQIEAKLGNKKERKKPRLCAKDDHSLKKEKAPDESALKNAQTDHRSSK